MILHQDNSVFPRKKRKKQYFIDGIINAINAAVETNFKIFKDFQARGDAKGKAGRYENVIDKRTGGMSLSYIIAIIAVIILIIVGTWFGFKKVAGTKK